MDFTIPGLLRKEKLTLMLKKISDTTRLKNRRFKEENDIIVFIHKSDNFWKTTLQEPGIVMNFQTEAQIQV